jgi:chemotaxis protein methyltransferase CheR
MNPIQNEKVSSREITTEDFHAFRDCLEEVSGIILSNSKKGLIVNRLSGLMTHYKLGSFSDLLERMKSDAELRESIMDSITINETSWFRDPYPFDIFKEKLLPEFARTQPQRVRVWSTACSTGEETYPLSMAADEYIQHSSDSLPANAVRILGTDISPSAIKKAQSGSFEEVDISRGVSPEKKQRYFDKVDGCWEVKEDIRNRVAFSELNLTHDYKSLGPFDIIFCRNVLTYFSSELKLDILSRLAKTLNPGGYLILGSTESLTIYSDYFEPITWRDGVVYKLKS